MTYRVWFEDEPEAKGKKVRAQFASDAAEEFVRHHEHAQADYPVARGTESARVCVRAPSLEAKDGKVFTFIVEGDPDPVYIARRVAT